MKKRISIFLIIFIVLGALAVGLFVYKNIRLDKGLIALKSEDYTAAIYYLKPLAVLGDPVAQRELGWMYAFGWGVKKDDDEAVRWFRKASFEHQNHYDRSAASAYYVGEQYVGLYYKSHGKSAEYAADALRWYKRSAEGGYIKSAEFLSKAYAEGLLGLTQDLKASQYWDAMAHK